MSDDYACAGNRSKKKDKFKRKKFFPYKKGGKWRANEPNLSNN